MILRQYLDTTPVVAASYLFGCSGKGAGAVVDPTEDVERYLRDADALGIPIRYVIDTHVHADHISGGRPLARAAGAEYVLFSELMRATPSAPSRRAICWSLETSPSACSTRPATPRSISPSW
jgi:hydroxyacylglutathione hydrolase